MPLLLLWSLTACAAKPPTITSTLDEIFGDVSLEAVFADKQPPPARPVEPPRPRYLERVVSVERGPSDIQLSSGESAAAVKQVRRYMGSMKRCYEHYVVHAKEALKGQMVAQVTIEAGRVTQSKVVSDTIKDEGLTTCIEKRASRWRFAEATAGDLKQTFEMSWEPSVGP
jgi:hypothetical protein